MALNTTITAGDLRDKVILKKPVQTGNGEGGTVTTYPTNTLTVFGCMRGVDQRRVMEAGTDALIDSKELFIRDADNRGQITKDWLVVHNGTEYVIQSKESVQNRFLFLRFVIKSKGEGEAGAVVVDDPVVGAADPTGPFFTIEVGGSGVLQFAANQPVTVDFGDGTPVTLINSASHNFPSGGYSMKVYHHNAPTLLTIVSNFVTVQEITGTLPNALQTLTVGAFMPVAPTLTGSIKVLKLVNNALTVDEMDGIIVALVGYGQEDGELDLRANLGNVPSLTAGIAELESRGWTVLTGTI